MRKSTMFNLFVVAILGLVLPDRAFGQQKPLKDLLVGTWLQVSIDVTSTDGTRRALFGDNPKGIVIYTNDGYFSLMQAAPTCPNWPPVALQQQPSTKPRRSSSAPSHTLEDTRSTKRTRFSASTSKPVRSPIKSATRRKNAP